MAIGGDGATQLASLLIPLLTDKKTQGSVTPGVTNNFNQLMAALMPQAQNNLVGQGDLDALLQSVMSQASRAFAPNKSTQAAAGMYNSSSLDFMRNDANAKAVEQAMQVMLNAKLQGQQQQLSAGQLAGQLNSNMGQLTQTQTTPAALGGLAGPAAAYALYKFMQPGGAKQTTDMMGLAGKAGGAASSADAASQVLGGANLDAIISSSISGMPAAMGGTSKVIKAAGALGDIGGAGGVDDLLSFNDMTSTANFGATLDNLMGVPSGAGQLGGTADSISNLDGDAAGGFAEFVGGIPIIGEPLGKLGEAASGISDFFTPEIDIPGFGPTGIPLLAGLGNIMQGDFKGAAGNIGGSMAGSAAGSWLAGQAAGSALGNLGWAFGPIGGILGSIFGGKLASKCYITTAVMAATGDPDDSSYPLETLRKYRDDFMSATPAGQELIQNYYDVAPKVVAKLSAREDAKEIYAYFYHRYIVPAVKQIEAGDNYAALTTYREMSQFAEAVANEEEEI